MVFGSCSHSRVAIDRCAEVDSAGNSTALNLLRQVFAELVNNSELLH